MSFFTITTSSSSCYIDDPPLRKHSPFPIIPLSAFDGYVSPSGGLISYGCFDIRGKNLSTKRKVRRYFEAQTEELARKLAEDGSMAGPFEVTVRPSRPAEGCPGITDEDAASADAQLAEMREGIRRPVPAWQLSNRNGEIKRIKDRLAQLRKVDEMEHTEIEFDGGTIITNEEINRVQILFDEKPDEARLKNLFCI